MPSLRHGYTPCAAIPPRASEDGDNACMYRIALSHHDTDRRRITPRHRDTARTPGEAIEWVRERLPGVDLSGLTEAEVNASLNRVNDFRCDVPSVGEGGGEWRVVIAPMM